MLAPDPTGIIAKIRCFEYALSYYIQILPRKLFTTMIKRLSGENVDEVTSGKLVKVDVSRLLRPYLKPLQSYDYDNIFVNP